MSDIATPAHAPALTRFGRLRTWAMREIGVIVALLVVGGGLTAFLAIADEVGEGGTHNIDRAILYGLRDAGHANQPIGPHWLEIGAADITSLGSVTVLSLIVLLIAGLFAANRRWREAAILIAAPLSGSIVSQVLKQVFGRARPDISLHAVEVMNPSFPSGHAMLSAVVYLTLAVLVERFTTRQQVKTYALAAGILLSLLVGCSRVYLGVHWPTDVVAGWSLGAAWALAWWLIAWFWERRYPSKPREATARV